MVARFVDIRRFASIDSTNRYLLDEARRGAAAGVVAVADHQTAGRGRLDRRWEAPAGANLLVSVLLRPDLAADQRHLASAAVALAAADGVERATGVRLDVKWPNDLLAVDGRKVAGVLSEAVLSEAVLSMAKQTAGEQTAGEQTAGAQTAGAPGGQAPAIVVGVGLNVRWPATEGDLPDHLVGSAASLCQLAGEPVDREAVLAGLLEALELRAADLDTAAGRLRVRSDLRSRCVTLGREVRVELAGGTVVGTALDVTTEGHLVVLTGTGRSTVVAGDVVHLRAATDDPGAHSRRPGPE